MSLHVKITSVMLISKDALSGATATINRFLVKFWNLYYYYNIHSNNTLFITTFFSLVLNHIIRIQ